MTANGFAAVSFFLLMLVGYGLMYRRLRRRRVGTAAVGVMYDLLNEDRRNAVEIIVADKAAQHDPEDKNGKP